MNIGFSEMIAGIGVLLSALALPQFYKYLAERKKYEMDSKKEAIKLQIEISNIKMAVGTLLTVIETDYDDSPNIKNAIEKIKSLLQTEENE